MMNLDPIRMNAQWVRDGFVGIRYPVQEFFVPGTLGTRRSLHLHIYGLYSLWHLLWQS